MQECYNDGTEGTLQEFEDFNEFTEEIQKSLKKPKVNHVKVFPNKKAYESLMREKQRLIMKNSR